MDYFVQMLTAVSFCSAARSWAFCLQTTRNELMHSCAGKFLASCFASGLSSHLSPLCFAE
jgi:hypothetical protein